MQAVVHDSHSLHCIFFLCYESAAVAPPLFYMNLVFGLVVVFTGSHSLLNCLIQARISAFSVVLFVVSQLPGGSYENVIKTTILLGDMAYFPDVNATYGKYFPTNPPARSTFAGALTGHVCFQCPLCCASKTLVIFSSFLEVSPLG